jgi:predicted solute-binding protein
MTATNEMKKALKIAAKNHGAKANATMAKQLKAQLKKSVEVANPHTKEGAAKAENMRRAMAGKGAVRVTVASFMRDLIKAGKSNEEVFAAAQKKFGIGEDKKHYPSWYRCEMRRRSNAEKKASKKAHAKSSKKAA